MGFFYRLVPGVLCRWMIVIAATTAKLLVKLHTFFGSKMCVSNVTEQYVTKLANVRRLKFDKLVS